ncbi:hypothetical protein L1987_75074 [Smallanthus sonchifolius]|uniref:Uncharacterized protein n=1 Tax=Smallanthus sonchifolius TaxID=185202 RepID=A0ACB9A8U8_9ASTR|nr:hypothetical protein L1987_75074 [Smallanthus sonchifolius]
MGRVPSEDEANPDSINTQATTFSFGPSQTMVTAPESRRMGLGFRKDEYAKGKVKGKSTPGKRPTNTAAPNRGKTLRG